MTKSHRPSIKTNLSKWEFFLIVIHFAIIILQIMYYVSYWDSMPEIILTNSHRGKNHSKYEDVYDGTLQHFGMMMITILLSFCMPKMGYSQEWKGRSLSHDLAKAARQYRIETSNLLCISAMIHLFIFLSNIIGIGKQIRFGTPTDDLTLLPVTIIAILMSWLAHHVLWTRLSDK
jgi:magnesium-transporting ATPase (P-type)